MNDDDSAIVDRDRETRLGDASLDGEDRPADGSMRAGEQLGSVFVRHSSMFSLGLFLVGVIGLGAGWYVPSVRPLLVTIGTIAMFAGFLAYYLETERLVQAGVARDVYDATDRNQTALVEAFDLSTELVYIPMTDSVRLYVPPDRNTAVPDLTNQATPEYPGDEERGVTLIPTGLALFERFQETLVDELAEDPKTLAEQIEAGLVDTLEIAWRVDVESEPESGRLDVRLTGSVFPPGFDTPTASFIAVALASGLQSAVVTDISADTADGYTVRCHWNPERVATSV